MRAQGRFLQVVGALALLAWTGAGLLAWWSFSEGLELTVAEPGGAEEVDRTALLEDAVAGLREDVRALSAAVGQNFGALADEVGEGRAAGEEELRRLAQLEAAVSGLADEVAFDRRHLEERLDALAARRDEVAATAPAHPPPDSEPLDTEAEPPTEAVPEATAEPAPRPVEEPSSAPATRRSFLSFRLPSDDFRLDERRRWAIVPSLSRVGFDAKSTLHDFTGVTSDVEGELEVDLSRPGDGPTGRITARVATLTTGLEDRDEEMLDVLGAGAHPAIVYELTGFRPDPEGAERAGTALGRMTIRGVTRPLEVPLRWELDDANRLLVEGEAPLRLPDWQVPVPKTLGVIEVDEEVRVWLSLRARVLPRSE